MKKIIASCSSMAMMIGLGTVFAGGPQVVPMPDSFFDGFSVGVYGSFHHTSFDSETATTFIPKINTTLVTGSQMLGIDSSGVGDSTFVINTNAGGTSLDAYGGAQIDYGHVFRNKWYLGGSVFGELGEAEDTASAPLNSTAEFTRTVGPMDLGAVQNDVDISLKNNGSITTDMEIENGIGGAIKLGMLLSDRVLVYGKIGAERSELEVTTTSALSISESATGKLDSQGLTASPTTSLSVDAINVSPTASDEEWKTGFVLGAGAEYELTPSFSTFAEYTYTNYGNVDAGGDAQKTNQSQTMVLPEQGTVVFNASTTTQVENTELSAKVSAVSVGVKYKLPFWS